MKTKLPLAATLVAVSWFAAGCATKTTAGGGRETNVLAGVVNVSTGSFEPTNPATINADTSKIVGKGNPSGNKVTLLWGLITLLDY